MNRLLILSAALLLPLASAAANAQDMVIRDPQGNARTVTLRGVLGGGMGAVGVTVSSANTLRDTLGVLISAVAPGSLAEKAGIEEGHRIASINGVNLKLHRADAGEPDMVGIMSRRFQREMAKVGPGDSVKFVIWNGSQNRDVTVQIEPRTGNARYVLRGEDANHASLGAMVGGSASKRDTLGVFIAEVAEDGPLAKSGIYEGARIAAIGGVDLRVPVAAAGDEKASLAKVELLTAELKKLTPGNRVELRVYEAGRTRNVSLETVRRGDINMPMGGAIYLNRGGLLSVPRIEMLDMTPFIQLNRLHSDTLSTSDRHVLRVPGVGIEEGSVLRRTLQGLRTWIQQPTPIR